jgi:uncharacterized membrane protein YhaH (DUF805 family)
VGFGDAILSGFRKFLTFRGRAGRAEFWYWALFSFLVITAWTIVDMIIFGVSTGPLSTLATIALVPPGLAAAVRRLHDTARTGWWILLLAGPLTTGSVLLLLAPLAPNLGIAPDAPVIAGMFLVLVIPVISIIILVLMIAAPGTPGDNRYGADPTED